MSQLGTEASPDDLPSEEGPTDDTLAEPQPSIGSAVPVAKAAAEPVQEVDEVPATLTQPDVNDAMPKEETKIEQPIGSAAAPSIATVSSQSEVPVSSALNPNAPVHSRSLSLGSVHLSRQK